MLAIAVVVFLVAGLPMLGYAVAACAWLVAFALQLAAGRHARRALARGDRRSAVGVLAAATLGRVWVVALAILLVGLGDRESGLAAAVLAGVLVTVHLLALAFRRLLSPGEDLP